MRIRPSKLPRDAFGRGQYFRQRYRKRVIPEWWTWGVGNMWDWVIGNMFAGPETKNPKALGDAMKSKHEVGFNKAVVDLQEKEAKRTK